MVGRGLTLRAEEEEVGRLKAPSSPGKEETERQGEEAGEGERTRTRLRGKTAEEAGKEECAARVKWEDADLGLCCWDVAGRGRSEGEGRTEGELVTT